MPGVSMGTDEGLTAAEAAEILTVSTQRVYQMNREGLIHAVGKIRGGLRFATEEICALAEERQKNGSLGLPRLHARVIQLGAKMHATERHLQSIDRVLGLSLPNIGYDEADMKSLYFKAQQALVEPTLNLDQVREWSQVFLALHEEFFELLERYTDDPEPWRLFLNLGVKMSKDCPLLTEAHNDERSFTKKELDMARRNLRAALWLYITNHRGQRAANEEFPETDGDPFRSLLNAHIYRH
jgi:hypothetical protein